MIPLLAAAAGLWFGSLVVAPFLPAPISAGLFALGSFVCHQRPDRSFALAGLQLPVCARCLGLYAGTAVGAAIGPALGRIRWPRTSMLMSMVPAVLSLAVEWTGLGHPSNEIRAVTGGVAGFVVAAITLATLHYERCARRRRIVPTRPPTPI